LQECEALKELTGGKIDLSKSDYKPVNEALKCVHYALMPFDEPDPLNEKEQEWIYNANKGALIFAEKDKEIALAYSYDLNSAYPYMMSSNTFSFPVKEGVFTRLKELPEILSYGIYRVEISPSDDNDCNKLFRFNYSNYYTHYDIQTARKLGLHIHLIVDKEANALLYTTGRANGHQYFGSIIDTLYRLKKQNKLAKAVMNAIWGALCQKDKIKTSTRQPVNLNNDEIIEEINPNGLYEKVIYLRKGKLFKYNYARLSPFLLAATRRHLALTILPHKEHVFRCHTDSILSDIPLDDLKISKEMGDWKLEKTGHCIIYNKCNVEWD